MRRLQDILIEAGVSEAAEWRLEVTVGIAADGRTIAGFGKNPDGLDEGFIAEIPEPSGAACGVLVGLAPAARRR